MSWNYRIFRSEDPDGSPVYDIRETHYDTSGNATGWAESSGWPMGESIEGLVTDLAWFLAALAKPVLDAKTGHESGPAVMLEDELRRWINQRTKDAKAMLDAAPKVTP